MAQQQTTLFKATQKLKKFWTWGEKKLFRSNFCIFFLNLLKTFYSCWEKNSPRKQQSQNHYHIQHQQQQETGLETSFLPSSSSIFWHTNFFYLSFLSKHTKDLEMGREPLLVQFVVLNASITYWQLLQLAQPSSYLDSHFCWISSN